MALYIYWGDDNFALLQAIEALKQKTLDPTWESFNFDRISPDSPDGAIHALTQAMTPPFGLGKRLIWLDNPPLLQQCSEALYEELERTLPQLPDTTELVMSSDKKPNGRLKSTKLLTKQGKVQEFALIPPWKTELIEDQVRQAAKAIGVKLSRPAGEYLVGAVGNNTRQLHSELEKLKLFAGDRTDPLDLDLVSSLVTTSTQNSLQLASALRSGDVTRALGLLADLINLNEPPLRIVATLVGQFRTWLWVKVMVESGERDDKAIAAAAEVGNPKRVYFLQQEIRNLSQRQLLRCLPVLLELEAGLKRGQDPLEILQIKVIEICQICRH